ncbi:hypothetical protein PTTG_28262 [Puccinia triticina 1-1 BBBD Race 1]|uniref:Uncharacterized protein n=2 Tax=Puccinia triticina TaxID=208348 RepID=A0A180GDG7_PUCT1|nr:uncharacterized protein PtA15_7A80 [Puccinia triticina]OAV90579.1 hypothetical protein PTTG_28262 [Puccinia triticina 1-1 BBBD Race 1]WAQ86354.1 hypothetical protein PtA15_7A80 [Puccinia triticina]WAR56232.1 hypothetical protein PtB15_7B77 [Puccinia triticina]
MTSFLCACARGQHLDPASATDMVNSLSRLAHEFRKAPATVIAWFLAKPRRLGFSREPESGKISMVVG